LSALRTAVLPEGLPRLRVQRLGKSFGAVRALHGVDLDVHGGETLGLIGPNGSGKTTLVNCASGVLQATSGSVYLDGTEITRWPRHRRARAGLARTYQSVRLFPALSVGENVEAGLFARRGEGGSSRRRRVLAALAEQDLVHLERVPVSDLAYGMQRRVEIARALVAEPRVLLLDEPAAGLGEEDAARLRDLLVETQRRLGLAVLIIDHDVSLIMGVSDRIAVLHEGGVIFTGRPREVAREPAVIAAYLGGAAAGTVRDA
jgi:ABC-type branched-subunit amino acid transport system ATPase component